MRRLLALGLLIGSASLSTGCAMCCSPYDYAYGYYGGIWQREDLCNGRVGSVYAPAGSKVGDAQQGQEPASEPDTLPPPAGPSPELKPEGPPMKSVKRSRRDEQYLPASE